MSTPTPLPECRVRGVDVQSCADAVQQIAAPYADAANDPSDHNNRPAPADEGEDDDRYRNPLWLLVFATAGLFAFMAAAVSFG